MNNTPNHPGHHHDIQIAGMLRAREPDGEGFHLMKQRWEHLLFLHWTMDASYLQSLLPPGLVVDRFSGFAWVGIVPFFMNRVRPLFCPPVPGISWFQELNVRTYVIGPDGRPGVWFFSLDANQPLAVEVARRLYYLPYEHARIYALEKEENRIFFEASRKTKPEAAPFCYSPTGLARTATPGTLEFFLLERYYLYAWNAAGKQLYRGQVHHAPYRYSDVKVLAWSCQPLIWNGMESPGREPDHLCFSRSVKVDIYGLVPVE